MNYGELKTLFREYINRADLDDRLGTFLTMAQARINRDVEAIEMEARATYTTVAGERYITLPTDYRRLRNIQIATSGGRKSLRQLTPEQMDRIHGEVTSGEPADYAVYGNQFEIQPTPPEGTAIEIVYLYRLPIMSADADTNPLLDRNPNVYIYAAMLEVTPFLEADKRLTTWREFYEAELSALNSEAEEARFSGAPLQILPMGICLP